ncbi:MAG: AI-2E family transporter [Pseudoxanthomonas sp.]
MIVTTASTKALSHGLLDLLIRVGLITVLVVACYRVFHPFLDLMVWAVILAITLYPLQRKLNHRLGDREGLTAALIVLAVIALLMVPIYLLGMSLASSATHALALARSGDWHIPPPAESVAGWPLIGDRLYAVWQQAATDLTSLAQKFTPQIKDASLVLLGKLAGLGMGFLIFIGALMVAGIFMAYADAAHQSAVRIASRIFGAGKGDKITRLCTGTVRAVAQGVVGIAFIQMLLIGIAFVLMGVPGAALLALAVLLLGIMQIPATLITLPVIVYVFAKQGVGAETIIFAVYTFVAGLVDNVLKPLLLGRGVEVPMPVVLIGALGGMVANGIIGLFIGPVVLAVGYVLFWEWIEDEPVEETIPTQAVDPSAPA